MRSRLPRRPATPVRLIPSRTARVAVDGSLALAAEPAPGTPVPRGGPLLRAVPPPDADLQAAALTIARAFVEVLAGIRPLHHVAGRATHKVYDRLAGEIPATEGARHRPVRPPRVLVARVQKPAPGAAEVCAVAFIGADAQAIALRLERFRGRWRCSAVETTISAG